MMISQIVSGRLLIDRLIGESYIRVVGAKEVWLPGSVAAGWLTRSHLPIRGAEGRIGATYFGGPSF